MTDADKRETGKQWFMQNKSDLNIILLEEKKTEEAEPVEDPMDLDDDLELQEDTLP